MRSHAANWLELAEKVEHYRRDLLDAKELGDLQRHQADLKRLVKEKGDAGEIKLGIEALEATLRKTGGAFYPKRTIVEYVEFFLVAAIVIIGIRAYFIQPFKIPTNSMWPSYNGMTAEVFDTVEEEPNVAMQGVRFLTQLAKPKRIDAPASGEVSLILPHRKVSGRKWFVIPADMLEVTFQVGGELVSFEVPLDFYSEVENILAEQFFPGEGGYPSSGDPRVRRVGSQGYVAIDTGKRVQAGERILAFDILTGDQLFVDRISYHFVKPSVGDGFVFRTKNLTDLHPDMRGPTDQYYIKRLVGTPGDELEIRSPVLYRNGEPIEGTEAFDKNAKQEDRYPGYQYFRRMQPGVTVTVPEDHYMAYGDNSASSLDSRAWGAIPAQDVVGRPLFIYYPFTNHWGPAP